MWTLRKQFRFEAAHHLPNHDGKCRRVHGHSWVGEIEVAGDSLSVGGPKAGMLLDYGDLSAAIAPLVADVLDHHDLNETTGLPDPTSETLARFIFQYLRNQPGPVGVALIAVTIHETCTSACRYANF